MGWAEERRGNIRKAIEHYYAGSKTLESSADFTQSWHLSSTGPVKFVVHRLGEWKESLSPELLQDGYVTAAVGDYGGFQRYSQVRTYWLEQAELCEKDGRHQQAYWCYYAAGWDNYCFDGMEAILDCLIRSAESAGAAALSALAQLHRRCLSRT